MPVRAQLELRVGSDGQGVARLAIRFLWDALGPWGGSGQQIIVRVQASGGKTFKQGTAVASAEIFGCGTRVYGSETDSEAIQIQR
jgi:hypothetical protein